MSPGFALAVQFRIKPECVERFRVRVLQQAADSVAREPGCFQFDVLQDESDPHVIFLYETYADAAAFEDHRNTPHFADFSRTVGDWVESKQLWRLTMQASNAKKI